MGDVVQFPGVTPSKLDFERIRSTYSVRDISRRFGIGEHLVRRWAREGLIPAVSPPEVREIRFDLYGLRRFRHVRELRSQGLSVSQIDSELRGQLNLFPPPAGQLIQIPVKLSPFSEALLLHERGDPRARELYKRAITEGESVADAFCNLGILEFEEGNVSRAFDCFTRALRQDARHFESHFNLGNLYFESRDLRLARLHYEIAARIEPGCSHLFFNLGLVYAIDGDLSSAVEALTKSKEQAGEEDRRRADELLASLESILASRGEG
jgi:tetratricopeptide (TPR) repeat protein